MTGAELRKARLQAFISDSLAQVTSRHFEKSFRVRDRERSNQVRCCRWMVVVRTKAYCSLRSELRRGSAYTCSRAVKHAGRQLYERGAVSRLS